MGVPHGRRPHLPFPGRLAAGGQVTRGLGSGRRRESQLKVALGASEVAERGQALVANSDDRSSIPGTDSRELSSDLHVYTHTLTLTHSLNV